MAKIIVEIENGNLVLTSNVELTKNSARMLQELDIAEKIHADVRICKSDNKVKLVLTKRINRRSLSMESLCKEANMWQYGIDLIEEAADVLQRISNYEKDANGFEKAFNERIKKLLENQDQEANQGQN